MAGEWRETTLGEVTDFLSGGTPSKDRPDYWVGSVPWVSAKDMKRFRLDDTEDHVSENGVSNGTKLVPAGTVLLLARGMTLLNDLPICVISRPMTFNQDVKALRPKPHVRSDYLPYLLLGNKDRLLSLVDLAGHGTGRLNSDELKALDVTLPPLPEQRAIAHILGTLDDKIELNRRMNETLEAMARALFKSWFVDFDPVRAKAEGRDPGLPKPLADLFPARLVPSELGEIPEGWEVGSVESLCDSITSGGTPARMNPPYWDGGSIPWFKTGELLDGPLIESEEHITQAALDGSSCKLWPAGTILFALYASPTVGRLGVLTRPGTSNQAAAGLIAKSTIGVPFLRRLLLGARVKLQTIAVGAAQQNINQAVLKAHRVVIPSGKVASAYSRLVAAADNRQVALSKEANALAVLRDTLLPKLVSGELRVSSAYRLIEEVSA